MSKKNFMVALAALLFPLGAKAQYTIYPIPQQQIAGSEQVSFTKTVNIICEKGIDSATRERARQVFSEHGMQVVFGTRAHTKYSNIWLGIAGSRQQADRKAEKLKISREVFDVKNKFDRHLLALTNGGKHVAELIILGEHTNATFYALASLEQMLDAGTQRMECVTLADYADRQSRGLVEGFYGYPYTLEVKKDLMRFLMRYKMNTYLYGAKSDPYHSQYWKEPYPTELTPEQVKNGWLSQNMIRETSRTSAQTKVNFIWAIHPGDDFVYKPSVINDIMSKFSQMHNLGIRQFAVFVDDVSVPSKNEDLKANADHLTLLQQAIEKKWNYAGATPNDTVRPLHFVPQIYSTSFAPDTAQYNRFFQALSHTPEYVTIYTTGNDVWSVPNSADLEQPKAQLGRDVAWWWNYPCNDNADGQLFTLDTYANFTEMPAVANDATLPKVLKGGLGLVSNPMQQGEVSKIPLFSVANYAWNSEAFDNISTWKTAFKATLPGNKTAQEAFLFLAPYLSYNDTPALEQLAEKYKKTGESKDLVELVKTIEKHCHTLIALKDSKIHHEQLLYNDLAPWLLKLQTMARLTHELIALTTNTKTDNRWQIYEQLLEQAQKLTTDEAYKAYALEGMGNNITTSVRPSQPSQKTLLPLVDYLKQHALDNYLNQQPLPEAAQCCSNAKDVSAVVTGKDTLTLVLNKPVKLAAGQWVGIQLPAPTRFTRIAITNKLPKGTTIVTSDNGKQWKKATGRNLPSENYIRYIGLANTGKQQANLKAGKLPFELLMPEATKVEADSIPNPTVWDDHNATKMHDGDFNTFLCIDRGQKIDDAYILKLSKPQPIYRVRLALGTTNGDYMKKAKVQISADGKEWQDLEIYGTSDTLFGVEHKQMEAYSYEATRCDFDGKGQQAQYVRFVLKELNDGKWLRVYEMEVNGPGTYEQPHCEDGLKLGYLQTNDADPSTSTAKALKKGNAGELIYHFQNYSLLDMVKLYCNTETMKGVEFAISTDLKNWMPVDAKLANGVLTIPFDQTNNHAVALKLTWNGTTAPAIHEVIEVATDSAYPAVQPLK